MKGTVKFFNRTKNFGFISGEDGKDYFVHISQVEGGEALEDNQEVDFESAETDRGLQAQKVRVL